MTTFAESETRIRRFLRDPNALIWSQADLITYYNDAQIEIAQKTGNLVRVENYYYPPQYTYSYMFDWEKDYAEGDGYQCGIINQATGDFNTYVWEVGYWLSSQQTQEGNYFYTHPWEYHYVSQAEPPKVPLHAAFDRMLYCAYDEEQLFPISKKELETQDPYHRERRGSPTNYYRPDDYSNALIPYPVPSTVVEQETTEDEVFVDDGGINSSDELWLDAGDTGIVMDIIDNTDAFFAVYTAQPTGIADTTDESDFEDWVTKYIEYAVLERAFGADTDGFIPSLRDYWKLRKEIGIKALLRFKRMMLADRDYRLGGQPKSRKKSRLRLPDGYPAI